MSANVQAQMEYEARERVVSDYNSQVNITLRRGMAKGIEKWRESLVIDMLKQDVTREEIENLSGVTAEEIERAVWEIARAEK